MKHSLAIALVTLLTAAGLTTLATGTAYAADKDCADFSSQKAAQIFFLNNGGPSSDPHALDADGDGVACETLPCPCYTGKTVPDGGGDSTEPKEKQVVQYAKVVKVVDGDTVRVRLRNGKGKKVDVRLIGIDTPEVYGGTECWGPQASKAAKRMLPRRKRVKLMSDTSQQLKDRYGRLLRYVHRKGKDVNRRLVVRGHAKVYVYNNKPFNHTKSYKKAQRTAKNNDRGLWGNC